MQGQPFSEGTPVYDVNGDKVGTVSEHRAQENALVIHHGLWRDDIYVPLGDIRSSDANGVRLNVSKDDLKGYRWNKEPDGPSATGVHPGATPSARPRTRSGDINVPVREEELDVAKRDVERGRVGIHKDVTEEQRTVSAPVTHEEVRVERTPVDKPVTDLPPDAWQDKDIDLPVRGEELVAEKRAKVAEEVRVEKQPVTREQQVSGTVRKEQVHVDREGDVPLEGASDVDQSTMPPQR